MSRVSIRSSPPAVECVQVTCDGACFSSLGFAAGAAVRDLWAHEDMGVFKVHRAPRGLLHACSLCVLAAAAAFFARACVIARVAVI